VGSNPTGRVAREFCAKNAATYDFDALASGGLPRIFFCYFFEVFSVYSLPSVHYYRVFF
jgi:hypothetical protein